MMLRDIVCMYTAERQTDRMRIDILCVINTQESGMRGRERETDKAREMGEKERGKEKERRGESARAYPLTYVCTSCVYDGRP